MKKPDARKLTPSAQEALRIRVVHFLRARRGTQRQAAAIFELSLPAVEKIWKHYKAGGVTAVKAKKRGPRTSTARLSQQGVRQVKQWIRQDTPDGYHLPYPLWTAEAVRRLIKKKKASPIARGT